MFFYDLYFLFRLKKPIENLESLKLESLHLSWKELIEVRKFLMQYSITKYFSTFARTFQLYFSKFYFELSDLIISNFSFKKFLLFLTVLNFWVLEKLFIKKITTPCDSVADYDSDPEPETEPDYDCHPDSK